MCDCASVSVLVYCAFIFPQIQRAEVKMCILLAQHNVPLAFADHLSPLIHDVFDGEVAKGYACAKTKTSCILNGAVAPEFLSELVVCRVPRTHCP